LDDLGAYLRLLARWNATVNLTSLALDPPGDETFDRLVVEPIVAAERMHGVPGGSSSVAVWYDLGSGGGSPAIPLKLVRSSWTLTMVESRERKAMFLREAGRHLKLAHPH